mmetsp:Transcript_25080/g.58221  ORF Transcript_25080/g.58221 Transcript_25080/m.58221 type:complete len:679 (-) Transcript_25080:64-2100(-)
MSLLGVDEQRHTALTAAAEVKRRAYSPNYYDELVVSAQRWFAEGSSEAWKEQKQVQKDLHRTFENLLPASQISPGTASYNSWESKLERLLTAQIVRAQRRTLYTQGMNFLAGMCLMLVREEATAFWLYCKVLEDVLDPHFFATGPVALIGYQAMQTVIKKFARSTGCCTTLVQEFGKEFDDLLDMLLVHWLFSGFVNCLPTRLLRRLWQELLIDSSSCQPRYCPASTPGLVSIALAVLTYCGEARFRPDGSSSGDGRMIMVFQDILHTAQHLPEKEDFAFLECIRKVAQKINPEALQEELRIEKKRIADPTFSGEVMASSSTLQDLVKDSHFTAPELERMHAEFRRVCEGKEGCDLETFKEVVRPFARGFPVHLCCEELFHRLDYFKCGRLSFVELIAGTSVLLRGGVDEKARMMFNIFDSDRVESLGPRGVLQLCTVIFRLTLSRQVQEQAALRSREKSEGPPVSFSSESAREDEDTSSMAVGGVDDTPSGHRSRQISIDSTASTPSALRRSLSEESFKQLQAACEELEEGAGEERAQQQHATKASLLSPTKRAPAVRQSVGRVGRQVRLKSQWTLAGVEAGSRSLLLKLLLVAEKQPEGMRVPFDGFRRAIITEVQILMLFSWCLPEPPDALPRSEENVISLLPATPLAAPGGGGLPARCCRNLRRMCSAQGCAIL